MCKTCEKIKTIDFFPTPKVYFDCLKYIQGLVDGGDFEFELKDCDTDRITDENGCWIKDVIAHVIRCKNCGQCFSCTIITNRGNGCFRKGK